MTMNGSEINSFGWGGYAISPNYYGYYISHLSTTKFKIKNDFGVELSFAWYAIGI